MKRKKLKKIGFEPAWLNLDQHQKLKDLLPLGASLQPIPGIVETLRMTKSPAEIDMIRKSVRVNSEAYARTLRRVRLGMRERDIAAELDYQMRLHGAEKPAFDTIVAAGARSALPHAQPTGRRLEENDLLLIDMGACLDGYMSDMTRMAFLGLPSKRVQTLYERGPGGANGWDRGRAARGHRGASGRGRPGSAKKAWTGPAVRPFHRSRPGTRDP